MNDLIEFSLLTEPMDLRGQLYELGKTVLGRHRQYGGHASVTKGLIEGLDKIQYIGYNYRPSEKHLKENVHVLGGVNALKYAIDLKKQGKIKKLSAGPNIVVFPFDANGIIARPEVDLFLLPSEWNVRSFIGIEPSLEGRCKSWPVGVNMDDFLPQKSFREKTGKKVLIYHKDESDQMCWQIEYFLKKFGYDPFIVKYGHYNLKEYKELLQESLFMVSISSKESQGIFLSEAWSMDVPTICFDRHFYKWSDVDIAIEGDITSCPYLDKQNGFKFSDMKEFVKILEEWDEKKILLKPREWCEKNMSDIVCAKRFISLITEGFMP